MAEATDIAGLVNRMPELDKAGKVDGPTWEKAIAEIYKPILAAGAPGIVGVIDLLREVDDGEDYKARYTLHSLCVYCCRKGLEKERGLLIDTLVAQLKANRPKAITGFLVRQLQVVGDARVIAPVGAFLQDEEIGPDAANVLLAIRTGAIEQFRAALPKAQGRMKLITVQALGVLKDAGSVDALKQAAGDGDRDIRIAAVWGLANLGEGSAADLALKAAGTTEWERIQGVKSCLVLAEKLLAAGKKDDARKLYQQLAATRTEAKEEYIKEICAEAIKAMG